MPTPDDYISMEEYHSWRNHPVTRIIAVAREREITALNSYIGNGGTLDSSSIGSTAINTAIQVGCVQGLKRSLDPPDYLQQTETEQE